jgi:hypothetical protein
MEDISAKKIQLLFRINQILKNLEQFKTNELLEKSKTLNFNQLKKILLDKKIQEDSKNFLISLNNYKKGIDTNPKMFLTLFLITGIPDEFLGPSKDRHFSDKDILILSNEVIELLTTLNEKNISTFWNSYQNYNVAFKNWLKMDKNRTIERAIVSYYHRSEHIEKINKDLEDKKGDSEQLIEMKNELEVQRKDILRSIKLIDRDFDLEYLKDNYKLIYSSLEKSWKSLINTLSVSMKKAYYDMLVEDIEKGNKINLFNLVKEISERLLLICPEKRKESLKTKFSDDIISELLINSDWSDELSKFIIMIVDMIILLGAVADDNENKKWKQSVLENMKNNYNLNFPKILIEIEEKIDRIYQLIIEFNEKNQNNK